MSKYGNGEALTLSLHVASQRSVGFEKRAAACFPFDDDLDGAAHPCLHHTLFSTF